MIIGLKILKKFSSTNVSRKEDLETKLHDLLNFLLLFEFHYKACYFQNEKLLTLCCVAHWLLISFFGNFPYFWKSKSMIHTEIFYKIMLIRIPGLKNDSCIFFSSLKFFTWIFYVVMVEQQLEQYLCVTFFLRVIGET